MNEAGLRERRGWRSLCASVAAMCAAVLCNPFAAEAEDAERTEFGPGEPWAEPTDSTRLDVARMPAEAVEITRDLYAHGLFTEAQLGVAVLGGDLGAVGSPGPRLSGVLGYELLRFLALYADVSGSFHDTHHRAPPESTSFELVEGHLGARFQVPFGPRAAIWAAGSAGIVLTFGDVLRGLGFAGASKPSLSYGGELGFDWHMRSLHHSLGVLAGSRLYPDLARNGTSLAGYSSAYLRYVF